MNVVNIGTATATLTKVPRPPVYMSDKGKKHYKIMAKKLITAKVLKDIHLNALEIYGEAMAQWEFAQHEISRLNNKTPGSGYVQEYKTGAKNITTEIVIRDRAIQILWKCFDQFGLNPAAESKIKTGDPNQLGLFQEMTRKLKGG